MRLFFISIFFILTILCNADETKFYEKKITQLKDAHIYQIYDFDHDSLNDTVKFSEEDFKATVIFGNQKIMEFYYPEVFPSIKPQLLFLKEDQIHLLYSFPDRGTSLVLLTIEYKNNNLFLVKEEKYIDMFPSITPISCINKTIIKLSEYEENDDCREKSALNNQEIIQTPKNLKYIVHQIEERYFFAKFFSRASSLLLFKKFPLSKYNCNQYNDIAYYLQQAGANQESAYLLEKIIEKFPDRTVAYFNLGDACYGLGDKTKAIKAYQTYIDQMKKKGWEKKIPKWVLERVQTAQ
jgi:tetratricopeptide (TPR) repeat protein